jgi:two-component system phosphate regulon sensor histidine kinase PhoR
VAARRIQERLLTVILVVVGGGLLPSVVVLHQWMSRDVRMVLRQSLTREVQALAEQVQRSPPPDPSHWVVGLAHGGERITLFLADGQVVGDSEVPPEDVHALENHADRPEVAAALQGKVGWAERRSATYGRNYLYVAARGGPYVVRVAVKDEDIEEILSRPTAAIWLLAGAGVVLALLLNALLVRWLTRPLKSMTRAVRAMSRGDFGKALPEPPIDEGDEIGELVHALETLRSQMAERIEELRTEGKKLRTILNGMDEGVALIQDGAIAVANPAFGKLLGAIDDVEGRGPLEVSRLPSMAEVVEEALAGRAARREVQVGTRSLLVQAHPLAVGQAVLVLFDTTEARRLERLRRDFVANASHELRTPVAAIVGVADTLAAGAAEDPIARSSFVDILGRHAHRLAQLTADLLDIARIEAGYKPRVESVPVDAVLEAVSSSLRARADEKRITLEVQPAPALTVRAERAAVEQILTNFLDNALKYTPDGGRVRVLASLLAHHVRLTVEDSGPGIEPKHLARIFERFYRVDNARSRELGGTGLGLSIVKHLALANGGDVGVESQVGRGSRFYVDLPQVHEHFT